MVFKHRLDCTEELWSEVKIMKILLGQKHLNPVVVTLIDMGLEYYYLNNPDKKVPGINIKRIPYYLKHIPPKITLPGEVQQKDNLGTTNISQQVSEKQNSAAQSENLTAEQPAAETPGIQENSFQDKI